MIADAGPINYLILIGHIELLAAMFDRVVLPDAVEAELLSSGAPLSVASWMASPPKWVEVVPAPEIRLMPGLHRGEAAAIKLAADLHGDLLLIDDRRGVREAKRLGLRVTGTLGVLDLAAERRLINFQQAIRLLDATNFRRPIAIMAKLLTKHDGTV